MLSTHPRFPAVVRQMRDPIGDYTHVISRCPRCGGHIGINRGMLAGLESIICKGRLGAGTCNGHYYWRNGTLEFVGTR